MRIRTFWLTTLIVCALSLSACDDPQPSAKPTRPAEEPEVSLGMTAACPLCVGHEIEVTNRTPTSAYEGTSYYFCSSFCKKAFDRDPAAALAKHLAASTQPTSTRSATAPAVP